MNDNWNKPDSMPVDESEAIRGASVIKEEEAPAGYGAVMDILQLVLIVCGLYHILICLM